MSNNIPTFPKWFFKKMRLDDSEDGSLNFKYVLATKLRKYCDQNQKWYYWNHVRSTIQRSDLDDSDVKSLTENFITEVYHSMVLGRIDHNHKVLYDGTELFTECEVHISEQERILNTFK